MSGRPTPGPVACRTSKNLSPRSAPEPLYKHDWTRRGRTRLMRLRAAVCISVLVLAAAFAGHGFARAEPRDFIHADGARLVDGSGNQFDIKGINLGNWLVPEG